MAIDKKRREREREFAAARLLSETAERIFDETEDLINAETQASLDGGSSEE